MATINLSDKQLKVLFYFFDQLSNELSNAGCNDLPKEIEELFTPEEGKKIAEEFAVYNNPEKPDGPDWPIADFCLLHWLKEKIRTQIKE